ncbi:SOS response-associated peptidase [Thalassotalea sp. ND16A]|uniref:SOS response-associated peptidase n=1 Tax=Thalassotalea sp. ND16A TaxID=1535422 RepID=UPI00051E006A|nr:SOS response-associated peptidase family protein [Thalassotalea sp. ND16A]KGK00584.1 hypothetical protein ND16A_3344 [Thalassotalea sp. ND16A]
MHMQISGIKTLAKGIGKEVMCGRFAVNKKQVETWLISNLQAEFHCQQNLDLCPSQTVSTIIKGEEQNSYRQQDSLWGIKPAWANKLIINAQAETVREKGTFKQAFAKQRCIIPCSSWFEWQQQDDNKQKFQFSAIDDRPLFMAGIYYLAKQQNQSLVVTLTTTPTAQCEAYHRRMPLLLQENNIEHWLLGGAEQVVPLLDSRMADEFKIVANE